MHIWQQNIVSRHQILLSILQTKVSHVFAGCLKSQKSQIIPADWWFLTCDSIRQSGEPYPWWYSQNRNFPRKMRMANGKIHPWSCRSMDNYVKKTDSTPLGKALERAVRKVSCKQGTTFFLVLWGICTIVVDNSGVNLTIYIIIRYF